jgi:hypothetical protein
MNYSAVKELEMGSIKKLFGLFLSLVLIAALALPAVAYAASPDKPGKPDKEKPVPATNIEVVKKVTVKGKGRPITPPGQDKKKGREGGAATGIMGQPVSGSRYAVIVGISDYPGVDDDLRYCDDDASEMAQALKTVYGFNDANVNLIINSGATRSAILTAIEDVPLNAGEIVFFFSGHGLKGIAEDGDKERMDEGICVWGESEMTYIWDGELKAAFSGFSTSRIIFVFDSCLCGGMKKDLEEPGRVIDMATTENSLSIESDALQNGEFSYYFVDDGILQGKANVHDYDNDDGLEEPEQVTVEEAFDYAKANCGYDRPTIGDEFDDDLLP